MRIPTYDCPSDNYTRGPYSYTGLAYTVRNAYRTSYGVVYPIYGMATSYNAYTTSARKTAFGHNGAARFRDITDGSSNSMLIIETPLEKEQALRGPFWQAWVATGGITPYDRKINQPNSATDSRTVYGSPGSKHVGGCHVLLGDGAIRFLSENINIATQRALASIGGGEIVGEF